MDFVPAKNELICGEVGSIRIWSFERSEQLKADRYELRERLAITKNLQEDWVTFVHYERVLDRFFAACDTNLYVYDQVTGERIDSYYNVHHLPITCVTYYEPSEYLITGGKDGGIKVWNAKKYLIFDFHEHFSAITGFALVEKICEGLNGSTPLLLSSSLDSTIRMWNFETGQALERVDTQHPCLGLSYVKKNQFFHFTQANVTQWNINLYHQAFAFFR